MVEETSMNTVEFFLHAHAMSHSGKLVGVEDEAYFYEDRAVRRLTEDQLRLLAAGPELHCLDSLLPGFSGILPALKTSRLISSLLTARRSSTTRTGPAD